MVQEGVVSNPVIILGTGGTREACPFDCETWGVNGVYAYRESLVESGHPFRLDKLFITDTLFSTQGTLHFDIERVNQIIRALQPSFTWSISRLRLESVRASSVALLATT